MPLLKQALRLALGARLPIVDGTIRLDGIEAPVTIRRDAYSIPHIEAQNDTDAWFGLGFCQGQDRAFQLELRLRTVRGTLSAVVGPKTLAIDRLSRRIGLRYAAERQLTVLAPEIRAHIEAFARGINAGMAQGSSRKAHEFLLLRSEPSPWDAADVLGIGKLMSLLLIGNWDVELARLQILRLDGEQALRDLDPSYPPDHPVSAPPGALAGPAVDRLSDDLAALVAFAGASGGSNNWAISASKTATGRPLLANDPHLDPTLPPHWYLAHLQTPAWGVAGASLLGGPAIGAGHNGFAAWGITAALTDTVDLFIEEAGPDGRSVRQGEGFVVCPVRREIIEVKGAPPVVEEVLDTPRGPVIGPALEGEAGSISMSAVWLQPRPARGFLNVHKARSFEAFRHEFEEWPHLNQNVVYADTTGVIAWQLVGEVPQRRRGWGTLPQPGWESDAGWHVETVPFEQMPRVVNPLSGFVATANNKPVRDEDGGPYLGVDWVDGYRVARIIEALETRNDWDVALTLGLQMDETSLAWREARETVLALEPDDEAAAAALGLLRDWDGVISADSPASTLYELFVADMWRRVVHARAPTSHEWAMGRGFTPLLPLTTFTADRMSNLLKRLRGQPEGWFADGWRSEMLASLADIVRRLRAERGPVPSSWRWGDLRPLMLEHPVGAVGALAPIFNRGPFPWGGDGGTVSQAGTPVLNPLANPNPIASVRAVIDVGEWENSRFVLPGGQSGNPFSPHYDDLLPLWLQGEGVAIAWSSEAVAAARKHTLKLMPLRHRSSLD
jgi:penicillin amidase